MSTNSEEIVLQVRAEFEGVLALVLNATPQTPPTADAMERRLLRRVLDLGRLLLQVYFLRQSERCTPETVTDAAGSALPYHSEKERPYHSVFGTVRFARRYYYRSEQGQFPLDAALNLPLTGASDLVREWREQLGVFTPYHKVGGILKSLLGQTCSTRILAEDIQEDAQQVQAYYAQAAAPVPDQEASILVVQADGKGVPMIQETPTPPKVRLGKGEKTTRKKEALVTSVYTLAPQVRTPEEVLGSLFHQTQKTPALVQKRSKPHNKRLWATLEGKEAALQWTAKFVAQQEGPHIRHRVALTDGSEALQTRTQAQFPDFVLILDLIHADEYLWKVANVLLGETAPQRTEWVSSRTLQILSGQTHSVIAEFREQAQQPTCKAEQQKTLLQVAAYYERNLPFMRYDFYLAQGWPIATGVIEGACRHLVKDRCELSGMRWSQPGAQALLRLRCVAENGQWEDFHIFRRQQRQAHVYGIPAQATQHVELRMAA